MQCADDDEIVSKKAKHSLAGKSSSASHPSSDCELKVAARVKELKGKPRRESPRCDRIILRG